MHDLVIRGGTVVDGTGADAFAADVAIKDGVITAVGRDVGKAHRVIQADGRLVTPGFVDMHTHYDGQVTWDPYLTPSSWHGVTTVVMGNCGVGFAPARPDEHDWLIGLMEGVEDIPGAALTEGIKWNWESFPEYLDAIGEAPCAIDFGTQIPHGALRPYVMGARGCDNEEATPDDIAEMARLVGEAIEAGALGFSTSRTLLHKTIEGEYMPGTFASRDEIFGIGRVLGRLGKGVFQTANEHLKVPEELEWMRALADEIRRPVLFNISQTDWAPDLWRGLAAQLDEAAAAGTPVFAQVAGRAIGILMSFQVTAHPFATHPSWTKLDALSWEEKKVRLRDPAFRAQLLGESQPEDLGAFETFVTTAFNKMFPLGDRVNYEPEPNTSVAAIAERTGRRPLEVAWDMLAAHDFEGFLYFPLFNYADGNLDLLHELHQHPRTLMGLSDGGAHCGAICDGGMPTFMLTHWTRDRTRGPLLPLEHIVRRQTQETARMFGLLDRGVLKPGYLADVNVIDYDKLNFGRPRVVRDLPAGGRRLVQRATGYVATVKSGAVIAENGEPTGVLPGGLIRGGQSAPG
jgi:N-acyl-D-aspartate/D-glutamate deacylase